MKKLHSARILLTVSCSTHSSGIHFYFTWKNKGKTVIEYKILKILKYLTQNTSQLNITYRNLILCFHVFFWQYSICSMLPSNGTLSENYTETQNQISVSYDFCKLWLTEKYFILNDLGKTKYLIRNLNLLMNVTIRINCVLCKIVFYVKIVWIRSFLVFDILVFYIQ